MGQDAFPTAQGGGRKAIGGRNGKVVFVDNTNNDGAGSFRAAVTDTDPAIVVFRVSGRVNHVVTGGSTILNIASNKTILGQTSKNGFTTSGIKVWISGKEQVILRGIAFRSGDVSGLETQSLAVTRSRNVIVDSCSMSWGTDEIADMYNCADSSFQFNIVAEALHDSVHSKGPHGYGGIYGGNNVSVHHNLFAHATQRMIMFAGSHLIINEQDFIDFNGRCDFLWNTIYNWSERSGSGGKDGKWNMIRNFLIVGPALSERSGYDLTFGELRLLAQNFFQALLTTASGEWSGTPKEYGKWWLDGNVIEGQPSSWNSDNWLGVRLVNSEETINRLEECKNKDGEGNLVIHPIPVGTYNDLTETLEEAHTLTMQKAGYRHFAGGDTIDNNIKSDVTARNFRGTVPIVNGSGRGIINSQTDVGGYLTVANDEQILDGVAPHYLPAWLLTKYGMSDAYDYTLAGTPITRPERFIIFKGGQGVQLSQYVGTVDYENDTIRNIYEVVADHVDGGINILEGTEPELSTYTLTVSSSNVTFGTVSKSLSNPVTAGATDILTATPVGTGQFQGWYLGSVSFANFITKDNPYDRVVNSDATIIASFIDSTPIPPEQPRKKWAKKRPVL